MLLSAAVFAQSNWTGVKETNINVSSALNFGVDIFTNRDGNHIIVQESNNLKYYNMNINGQVGSPETIEEINVSSPSISGNADNIYIVYGVDNKLRVRRSTDGGSSWDLLSDISTGSSISWMESVVSNGNLHVTYQWNNKIWYRYRNQISGNWTGELEVSINENGTNPRITARYDGSNDDYVFFLWQKQNTHQFNHRRYEVTQNSWGDVLPGYEVSVSNLVASNPAGIRVTGSTLIVYYAYEVSEPKNYIYYFNWVSRDIDDNEHLGTANPNFQNTTKRLYTTTTSDNVSHTAAYYLNSGLTDYGILRSKSTSGYWDDIIFEYNDFEIPQPGHINLSSAGNDVHVIWTDQFGDNDGDNLRYKYDDQDPLTPANFAGENYNNHPKGTWTANQEPDISLYEVWRRFILNPQNPGSWTLFTTTTGTEFVDYGVTLGSGGMGVVEYKIRAKDVNDNYSDYSNVISFDFSGLSKQHNNSGNVVEDFEISQNFPNPFNPSTVINYAIPEDAIVSIKVYDMLGTEVAELVNEMKTVGYYETSFNASNLSSGVYVYRITALRNERLLFSQSKQMILLK